MSIEKITKLREKIAALQTERAAIEAQPRSRNECGAEVNVQVKGYAAAASSHIDEALARLARGESARPLVVDSYTYAADNGLVELRVDLGPWLVALLGEEKVAGALIDHLWKLPEGLDAAVRRARLAKIAADLDKLEAEEEALVDAAGIERRPDARPEIVLAV